MKLLTFLFILLIGVPGQLAWADMDVTKELLLLDCDVPEENLLLTNAVSKIQFPRYVGLSLIRIQRVNVDNPRAFVYQSASLDQQQNLTVLGSFIGNRQDRVVTWRLRIEVSFEGEGVLYIQDKKESDLKCRVIIGSL